MVHVQLLVLNNNFLLSTATTEIALRQSRFNSFKRNFESMHICISDPMAIELNVMDQHIQKTTKKEKRERFTGAGLNC